MKTLKELQRASLIAGLKKFGLNTKDSWMASMKEEELQQYAEEFNIDLSKLEIPSVGGSGLIWHPYEYREETISQSMDYIREMVAGESSEEISRTEKEISNPVDVQDLYGDFAYCFDPEIESVINDFRPLELGWKEFYVCESEEGIILKVTVDI